MGLRYFNSAAQFRIVVSRCGSAAKFGNTTREKSLTIVGNPVRPRTGAMAKLGIRNSYAWQRSTREVLLPSIDMSRPTTVSSIE